MKKLKSSLRVEERRGGITCIVTRYICGHGRPFHGITESSQGRVTRLLNSTLKPSGVYIEYGSIALVGLFYCEDAG